ncbi:MULTISPECIES: 5'-methylthioadenosine/S-adenosylhomocysteine nucleosidase [Rhizobium/Agrobacterium group]|jgi:adenosylhomocysteine nucleosidase|uniref:5'-methylthioadenosine/S-adenosylhomocysteine nucleosidase n=1 Tax=Rhizobium/Agrobacterium group TaxID=227290 RepID=UPI0003F2034F|nr:MULTISPECIES: 5'-methylthioadenosine/S-adenosylhomocysteine nucleosidase [Rhizobium/Agrobacterium group]AHK00177.1 5'-methylthioadenosine nucleosidase [Agrobacterium tumefaciens LBA4213 (Ach5)]AKC06041.1 5'-methylthioadenosine/S-adenosylhomocysteine nucleosidase [Agrobacterium tumefaciens]AYM17594.1 5'-methylthioadenosine/S-adenosylhomocysteine nucleosidase [Agrobacterium tumefaciens]AYM68893.1 5'-methylthioadenosine/S-adenosylhomocysteine nucleosidase [Agrobacterium tumefaciens]NIB56630.1 
MSYRLLHVADKSILFVMAASAEYGPHLQARIAPLMTGVGPVEAAISVTAILAGLDAAGHLPDLVVSLGSAGSRTLDQTGIYQAISVAYRDMDASAFGFEKGRTPFLDLPAEVALPLRIPDIAEARLSTGANVVSGATYGSIDADMVEMETYAVLRACQRFGVPLIGLRGISDGREDVNHVDDWTEYLHIIDEKLADAVDRLCRAIEDGAITL